MIFGKTIDELGKPWAVHLENYTSKLRTPRSIAFAFVSTHNHFSLDRSGRLFNRSSPVIKLPESATEDDHLALLGVLNTSTACFWLKQVNHDKGNRGGERSTGRFAWENFYEFSGTKLEQFPLPANLPLKFGRELDLLAHQLAVVTSSEEDDRIRGRMIALQEELDWSIYRLYGLIMMTKRRSSS